MRAEAATGAAEALSGDRNSKAKQGIFMGVGLEFAAWYGNRRANVTNKDELKLHTEFIL
jgi:hypothetical protein